MIDTVTITGVVLLLQDDRITPERLVGEWKRLSRQSALGGWEQVFRCVEEGVTITACLTTGQLDIRLSVPRWVHNHAEQPYDVNYPLVPFDRLDLEEVARLVIGALGCPPVIQESLASSWANSFLHEFGVRAVSFACDAYCTALPEVLAALAEVRLRQTCQSWSRTTLTGIQWQGSLRRLMFYDKAQELVATPVLMRASDDAHIQTRRRLSREAQGHLRMEVSYTKATQVRNIADLEGGRLPTLAWIARSEIGAYLLTHEARSVGLLDLTDEVIVHEGLPSVENVPLCCHGTPLYETVFGDCQPYTSISHTTPALSTISVTELARLIARLSSTVPGVSSLTKTDGGALVSTRDT